jgi:phosphatidylglycerol:prolipoprotein diacylglycerol transferase
MAIVGLILGIIGCRAMYLVHHDLGRLLHGEMGWRQIISLQAGRDIMGGVILGFVGVVVFLAISRRPMLRYLDVAAPSLILAMGIGRIGCFMFGCCWGGVCTTDHGAKGLPWAVRFPYGSPAYLRQVEQGLIKAPAELYWKLPKRADRELIPRTVLATLDIDDDKLLLEWADVTKRHVDHRRDEPGSPETQRLAEEQHALQVKLGDRPGRFLALQVAAAAHVSVLAANGDSELSTWADLQRLAAQQHSLWVHPAQFYDAIALVLLFFVLSALLYRTDQPGTVVAWMLILYSLDRFVQEIVRSDNLADTFFGLLTISQLASVIFLLAGIALLLFVRTRKTSSPSDIERQAGPVGV